MFLKQEFALQGKSDIEPVAGRQSRQADPNDIKAKFKKGEKGLVAEPPVQQAKPVNPPGVATQDKSKSQTKLSA